MNTRILVITGENSGIGKAAAMRFTSEEYRVIMSCRNMAASTIVRDQIVTKTGNEHVKVMELDIPSLSSIH